MTDAERLRPWMVVLALLLVGTLGGLLAWALWSLPAEAQGLAAQVRERLAESGVRAEVTAVLLNFRGYDTLLEVAVLLAAVVGAWQLGPWYLPRGRPPPGPVFESLVRLLAPVTVLVAAHLLWRGSHTAGGAFQAGALLAGAGVLLLLVGAGARTLPQGAALRLLLVAGPALFTAVAGGVMLGGGPLLEYPPAYAGALILLIEAACALSIGSTLIVLFAGGRPRRGDGDRA